MGGPGRSVCPNFRAHCKCRTQHDVTPAQSGCMLAAPLDAGPLDAPVRGRFTLPEDLETTWERMREELRAEVTDFIFHVWLEPLTPAGRVGDKLFISAPGHVRGWVRERYGDLLRQAAANANGGRLEIEL